MDFNTSHQPRRHRGGINDIFSGVIFKIHPGWFWQKTTINHNFFIKKSSKSVNFYNFFEIAHIF